jgi:hypothetical protein
MFIAKFFTLYTKTTILMLLTIKFFFMYMQCNIFLMFNTILEATSLQSNLVKTTFSTSSSFQFNLGCFFLTTLELIVPHLFLHFLNLLPSPLC